MRNFSITAVPPEVSSRSSVALFMFVLSVSQWPTRAFSFSNASAPPPGRAWVITGRIATLNANAQRIFIKHFIDRSPLVNLSNSQKKQITRNSEFSAQSGRFSFSAETLRRESHNSAKQHARNHDVPEQSHPRSKNYQQTQHCRNA